MKMTNNYQDFTKLLKMDPDDINHIKIPNPIYKTNKTKKKS